MTHWVIICQICRYHNAWPILAYTYIKFRTFSNILIVITRESFHSHFIDSFVTKFHYEISAGEMQQFFSLFLVSGPCIQLNRIAKILSFKHTRTRMNCIAWSVPIQMFERTLCVDRRVEKDTPLSLRYFINGNKLTSSIYICTYLASFIRQTVCVCVCERFQIIPIFQFSLLLKWGFCHHLKRFLLMCGAYTYCIVVPVHDTSITSTL